MTHPRVLDEGNVQLRLDNLESEQRRLDALVSGWTRQGISDPHFDHIHVGHADFDILPHPVASLRFASQNIGTGTDFVTPTVQSPSGATWAHGMVLDIANGEIIVKGIPSQSVIGFTLSWEWAANATGDRALQCNDNNGNSIKDYEFNPDDTLLTQLGISHMRRIANTDTFYRLQVWQDSGGDLGGSGLIVAYLIR